MFDSVPSNLPVEPVLAAPSPSPTPQIPTTTPASLPSVTPSSIPKIGKEPEDIFAGIQAMPQKTTGATAMLPVVPAHSRKAIIFALFGLVVLLGAMGGGAWAIFFRTPAISTTDDAQLAVTGTIAPPVVEKPPVLTDEQPVTETPAGTMIPKPVALPSSEPVVTNTQPIEEPTSTPPVPPRVTAPTVGIDSDHDDLTDKEEGLFRTDPGMFDSDGDGYSDGAEVANLFSPTLKGKMLTADPTVQATSFGGWTWLMPSVWKLTAQGKNSGFISTETSSNFAIQISSIPAGTTVASLFPMDMPLAQKKTKAGVSYGLSPNGHAAIFVTPAGDSLVRIAYDVGSDPSDEFESTFGMMLTSMTGSN